MRSGTEMQLEIVDSNIFSELIRTLRINQRVAKFNCILFNGEHDMPAPRPYSTLSCKWIIKRRR